MKTARWMCSRRLPWKLPFTEEEFRNEKKEKLADRTFDAAMELFKRKTERMAQIAYPVIKQVYENAGTHVRKHPDPHHRRKTHVQHLLQPESRLRKQNVRRW